LNRKEINSDTRLELDLDDDLLNVILRGKLRLMVYEKLKICNVIEDTAFYNKFLEEKLMI
jgi:hypothetical protein